MSCIRSKGTIIEKIFENALRREGFKFKKHDKYLIGKPDFILKRNKIAIFCDSAFWHGYKNMQTKMHQFKSRKELWVNKIKGNIRRDKEVNKILLKRNWKVLRFWDFEIKSNIDNCIIKVKRVLKQ